MVAFLLVTICVLSPLGARAGAIERDRGDLYVVVVVNAAGGDVVTLSHDETATDSPGLELAGEVAARLGLATDRRRIDGDELETVIHVRGKVATIVGDRFTVPVDTGPLQVIAADAGYSALFFAVCPPRVKVETNTVLSPSPDRVGPLLSPCRGWYVEVDDAAVTGDITLLPDAGRYPRALGLLALVALTGAALLGVGSWLLRRGSLHHRTWVSWLLGLGSVAGLGLVGWIVSVGVLMASGAATDPVLLRGGTVVEEVARTLLPGLLLIAAGTVPALVLLSAPRRRVTLPAAPIGPVEQSPALWWPLSWWPAWAQQQADAAPGQTEHR